MHFIQSKGILSADHTMNIYRGCLHNCIYCDSRSLCYQMSHDFEDIAIKENSIELLENELSHKKRKIMIHTGSMSDPYLCLEKELNYTRRALEVIATYGFGITILTKSDLILRDIHLLKKIHDSTKCVVQMTITTFDEDLCKTLEPKVCSTKRRFEVLEILQKEGIPTIVWLSPILPFINDTQENIGKIIDECARVKVYGIICFGMGVTLRKGNREYFYNQLDQLFPGLKEKYMCTYHHQYLALSENHNRLMSFFHQRCEEKGIVHHNNELFSYLNQFEQKPKFEQLKLF